MNTGKKCVIGLLSLVCCVATQRPAFAAIPPFEVLTNVEDGFESNRNSWGFVGTGQFYYNSGTAQTGYYSAQLKAPSAGTWAAVGRLVNVRAPTCKTNIFVKSASGQLSGNLEVIDPATWTYIALKPFTITSAQAGAWIPLTTGTWKVSAGRPPVYVRVAIGYVNGAETAYVDDMRTMCWRGSGSGFVVSQKLTFAFGESF